VAETPQLPIHALGNGDRRNLAVFLYCNDFAIRTYDLMVATQVVVILELACALGNIEIPVRGAMVVMVVARAGKIIRVTARPGTGFMPKDFSTARWL